MTRKTLAELLSGLDQTASREDLHGALDELLDAADATGGLMDGPAFWSFVAGVARGRGVTEDIAASADRGIASSNILTGETAHLALAYQWALLSALLSRVTAFPGEIMPDDFAPSAFHAVAANLLAGESGGEHMDVLRLGTQRGSPDQAERRAAKRLLVGAVYFRAEQSGRSVDEVRGTMMPRLKRDTWQGWVREVARAKRIPPDEVAMEPRAAARSAADHYPYALDQKEVEALFRLAWFPR